MSTTKKTDKLLSLSDIHKETGISTVSLLKYKAEQTGKGGTLANHTRGEGRKMRFTRSAVAQFVKLRREGLAKRGRPRKAA